MSDKIPFMPVLGSAASVTAQQPRDGYIYFTTDTRQIFVAKDGKMIEECGGLRLFYGNKDIEYDNSGLTPDPNVSFLYGELEETELVPATNDLILNKDGCFYRVTTVLDDLIQTTRLTLQGTGGGGGSGGGGGGDSTGGTFSLKISGVADKVYSSNTEKLLVPFISYYSGTDDNYIDQVAFYFTGKEDSPFYFKSDLHLAFNETHSIDLIECLDQFDIGAKKKVYIAVYDKYGNTRSTFFSVQIVELGITASTNEIFAVNKGDDASYVFTLTGSASGLANRKLIYNIYNENNTVVPIFTGESEITGTSTTIQKKLNLSSLTHGSYLLETKVTAGIIGSSEQLASNTLSHKLVYFDSADGNPILSILLPNTLEQYTNIPMKYLLKAKETGTYTLVIKLNGTEKDRISISSNSDIKTYNLYFEQAGNYTLEVQVAEIGYTYQTTLTITSYSGELPVIDPANESLMLYLTPRGKSNDSQSKDTWTDYNEKYAAQLSDFYYGSVNGWMIDEDQTPYLLLSSGAKLTLDEFKPFQYDPTKTSNSNSKMGYGMTIEIDFSISGVTDYDEPIISCLSTNEAGAIAVGFQITGDSMKMYNSRGDTALSSVSIVEDKRIRATFVIEPQTDKNNKFPLCLTYIDGIISGAIIYTKDTDTFKDSTNPATLKIDSTNAQVKIYGIRFYSTALGDDDILNNFTASLPTLEERQVKYDSNNIFSNSAIDLNKIRSADYDLQIPYVLIRGGYPTYEENKWQLSTSDRTPGLPTGKKTYKMCDVDIHYPDTPLFAGLKDYSFTNEFEGGLTMATAGGKKPTNGGLIIYGQGTSSMEYPIKNIRFRVKNEENYFTVKPDISPVEIICLKADYMDSSGSHNTGTGNLVDAGLKALQMKTPGQAHFQTDDNTIVTCIKGYPCIMFYDNGTDGKEYKYIGKYNLNLDKATPEPFGFDHDDSDFGYLAVGDEYYELGKDGKTETKKVVQEGEKINSIHCFEVLDNSINVCNFQIRNGDSTYRQTWYEGDTWTEGFESRYPEDVVNSHGADALYPLAAWVNELYTKRLAEEEQGLTPEDETITYDYTEAAKYSESEEYFVKVSEGVYEQALVEDSATFAAGTYYTRSIKERRYAMESLERFRREYEAYFDKQFLLYYYCITESLLLVDSRVKNMMLATWGKEKRSYKDLNGDIQESNNYIFYPIFYDMDTCLGLDNAGLPKFNYYDDDTSTDVYNGRGILWNFVRDALGEEIDEFYNRMEANNIVTVDGILPYYDDNQSLVANEAMYNGDARYKYIIPTIEGYHDYLYNQDIAPGAAKYLYAAQGPRTLTRDYWIRARVPYIRGKHKSTAFQSADIIEFRWNYPKDENDELLGDSIKVIKPDGLFNFKSLRTCFAGVKLGRNSTVLYTHKFTGEEDYTIDVANAENANGTEAYLLGVSNLKSVGDLSNKYIQKFIMKATDNKLEDLILGNPYEKYRNKYWGDGGAISLANCTHLKHFNLQNCIDFADSLDFSDCPYVEQILLTGSSTKAVRLPANGSLQELRLPSTVTKLMINSHRLLTNDNFTIGSWVYESSNEKRYVGVDGHYENDFSKLTTISVVDTPIDTYSMVKQARFLESYCLQGIDWTLDNATDSFYCKPDETSAVGGKTYYIYDKDEQAYRVATDTDTDFSKYRELVALVEDGKVARVPVLEFLKTRASEMDGVSIDQKDALVGTITINVDASVSEYDIYNRYHGIYPNLEIKYDGDAKVDKAYTIKFYTTDDYSSINDDTKTHYEVLTDGKTDLATLVSASGPNGAAIIAPVKTSTATKTYTFTGKWTAHYNSTSEIWDESDFASKIPSGYDYVLTPIYQEATRKYTLYFYQDDDSLIAECSYEYEDIPGNFPETPLLAYKAETDLGTTERYNFEGWISEVDHKNKNTAPDFYDLDTMKVNYDGLKMYAHYVVKDCTKVPMDLKYFDIKKQDLIFYKLTFNEHYRTFNEDGEVYVRLPGTYTIALKQKYWPYFKGRFTYPSYDNDNHALMAITDQHTYKENGYPEITEVYFLENAQYHSIYTEAFMGWKALEKIELPNTIRYFGKQAFENCEMLSGVQLNNDVEVISAGAFAGTKHLWLSSLPTSLQTLGPRAFVNSGGDATPGVKISNLPPTITTLGTNTFMACRYIVLQHVGTQNDNGIPAGNENSLKYLAEGALAGGTMTASDIEMYYGVAEKHATLYLNNSLWHIGYSTSAFTNQETGKVETHISTAFRSGGGAFVADGSKINLHSNTSLVGESNYQDYFGPQALKAIDTASGG